MLPELEKSIREIKTKKDLKINLERYLDKYNKLPSFVITQDVSDQKVCKAFCVFMLDAIKKPKDQKEERELQEISLQWHKQFLNYATIQDENVEFRIRISFRPESKNEIKIYLILISSDKSKQKALEKLEQISRECAMFLSNCSDIHHQLYQFQFISSRNELKEELGNQIPGTAFAFGSQNINFQKVKIGFSGEDSYDTSYDRVTIPRYGLRSHVCSFVSLLNTIAKQKQYTFIDSIIKPVKLKINHIEWLETLSLDFGLKTAIKNQKEIDWIQNHIQFLIEYYSQCFNVSVLLFQQNSNISSLLTSSLISTFFESNTNLMIKKWPSNPLTLLNGVETKNNIISTLLPLPLAILFFRFPFPELQLSKNLKLFDPAFDAIPENISNIGPVLGKKLTNQGEKKVRISEKDLRKHVYILGQTGTGKSTMLFSMIKERIDSGRGIGLIDPHGDLWQRVIAYIPSKRKKDVVTFNPATDYQKLGLNLLEYDPQFPEQKTTLINDMFDFFHERYEGEMMGPVFESYMKNAMLLVMDDPENQGTLVDVIRVFQDSAYRKTLLKKCKDQQVVNFWELEAEQARGEAHISTFSPYVTSKLNMFVQNHYLKPIISKQRSTVNFREIIDNKRILLIKLNKGKLGDLGLKLIGTILFTRIYMASLSRDDIDEEDRIDFSLFVDEFQNFTSFSIESILSEARKFRLSLILANQTIGQLKEKITQSVFGNVGNLVFFRPGINDYEKIGPYISPPFDRESVIHLKNFYAISRLQIDNCPSFPFVFKTIT
ncbi:MAG: DUF87 domain-containing protein [Tissierellales bacterium]|nr:DUF87 domain-containing protein [Tissierellales bacterium]